LRTSVAVKKSPKTKKYAGFADVAGSTTARAFVMPVSAVAVLWSSSLVTQQKGLEGFALFSIFVALPYMVPVSDFGISVSVTETLSKYGLQSPEFRSVWLRTILILSTIAAITVAIATILALTGSWSFILGLPASSDTELTGVAMMVIMAMGIPLGAGQRVLLGLGRQTTATLLTSSSGAASLLLVWVTLQIPDAGYAALAVSYGVGPLLMQVVIFCLAVRITRSEPSGVTGSVERVRVSILRVAVPMAVLTIALPLTYQTDRVLLSHLATLSEVANYSFVSMYYVPLLSIITIGSQALWPMFMKTMENPRRLSRQFRRGDTMFGALGLFMMTGIIIVGPTLTRFISDGAGNPPIHLYIAFGIMLVMFGLNASSGMLLMDYGGRKIQAIGAVSMLAVKVPLSLFLIPLLGATGAVVATLIPMTICMIIPTRVGALIRLRKGTPNT
jgi:O-antigen/teichoic acid export membrane protein